jgi:hypothetical protein
MNASNRSTANNPGRVTRSDADVDVPTCATGPLGRLRWVISEGATAWRHPLDRHTSP